MPKIDYPRSSPYYGTAQTSWAIGRYKHRTIPPQSDDVYVTILPRHEHRPDRLSQEYFGTPVYWWVFMVCNTHLIRDPIWDLKVGMTIRIPSQRYLGTIVG